MGSGHAQWQATEYGENWCDGLLSNVTLRLRQELALTVS
ncbi:hypothetical protein F4560_001859 [Saccharothrix ecbatanensis]|uniref:Uncharacterized protein n=1 Tax=Saccharothrix ecbatanensis TaxID=1105145 RepID=A0A7W9LZR8_9PSEU|nr:hypothetical protein [Saccharothrix ecbatanensis]